VASERQASRLVVLWEDLHVGVQVAIVAPVAVLALWGIHIGLLNQPLARGLGYGVFWGAILTGILVAASRAERARRLAPRDEDPPVDETPT
jgi:hypothetical protein